MAAGAWTFTNSTRANLLNALSDIDSDTYKMGLFLSTSNLSTSSNTFAALTNEVGTTNTGYTAGGIALAMTQSGTTTVTVVMTTAPVWTAGSANLTAKWAVIYEVSGNILCYATLDSGGADVTATNGNTLTVGSNGIGDQRGLVRQLR
jgi:hypothetical protein